MIRSGLYDLSKFPMQPTVGKTDFLFGKSICAPVELSHNSINKEYFFMTLDCTWVVSQRQSL